MFDKIKKEIRQNKLLIIFAVVVIIIIQLFGTVRIKGESMEPTFLHYDLVGINKLYKFIEPERGDIIVCNYDESGELLIKRVIGLPGDTIKFVEDEESYDLKYDLYINGQLYEEDYIMEPIQQTSDIEYPYVVKEDCYFVMGDNRNASSDSRNEKIGDIEQNDIMGKVFVRLYPFNSIEFFN